ncbi:MAG: hypothetical protein IM586_12535 [Pseudanabaena sp. M172S2SP2A07QC]|jgi:hypothetical protein|nr:hypothetical protein [Pseudanabaena sp. M172S2SP2A07QC]MCA6510282.1 hypothetical protein [Pseudanabaena sp. M109S1SP2A07QC]MCA6546668.1 hypothetical protein [Pseudanabaena sp. M152S2SP2A07QC]
MNSISIQTAQGYKNVSVMYKKNALQVIQAHCSLTDTFFYNTVHNNGLKLPETDTDSISEAIKICDWCVENFPEFAEEDLDISTIPQGLKDEFNTRLYTLRCITYENDQDFLY